MSLLSLGRSYVSELAGLVLVDAYHAADLRGFSFTDIGANLADDKHKEWRLHIQCPWRLTLSGLIVTGNRDWFQIADEEKWSEDWDPAKGGSLQEIRLRQMFQAYGASGLSFSTPNRYLQVISVTLIEFGDLTLDLVGGLKLQLLPTASVGESWRVFDASSDGTYFVWELEGDRSLVLPNRAV